MSAIQRAAKNKADVLFSKLVRAHGECEYCGATPPNVKLETAHWLSRRFSNTRTDFDNAFCLCSAHHRFFTADPTAWTDWAISQRGRETYSRLREAANRQSEMNWVDELGRLKEMARLEGIVL